MLTMVLALEESNSTWPTLFFGSEDPGVLEEFFKYINFTEAIKDYKKIFNDIRWSASEGKTKNHITKSIKPCYNKKYFWWCTFKNDRFAFNGFSNNESDLTRQELIDMCNFNIKSGHVFKCAYAAKTYLWLCMNRSKISSITVKGE